MFCPYCGTNIPEDSVICASCGREILVKTSEQPVAGRNEPTTSERRTDRWYFKLLAGLAGVAAFLLLFATPLVTLGGGAVEIYLGDIPSGAFFSAFLIITAGICLLIGFILSLCLKKVPGLFIAAVAQLVVSALLLMDLFQTLSITSAVGIGYIGSIALSIVAMVLGFLSFPAYTKYKIR